MSRLVRPAMRSAGPRRSRCCAGSRLSAVQQREHWRLTMSDHVDGPRSIGEPAADLTDLFAFTSPALGACVFPSAGEDAMFSNAIEYSIAVRRVLVAGLGAAARFQPDDAELRFSFRFEILTRNDAGQPLQRGVCTLPDGRTLPL